MGQSGELCRNKSAERIRTGIVGNFTERGEEQEKDVSDFLLAVVPPWETFPENIYQNSLGGWLGKVSARGVLISTLSLPLQLHLLAEGEELFDILFKSSNQFKTLFNGEKMRTEEDDSLLEYGLPVS